MKDRVRPLSFEQAQTCETAREPRCKCRCGGALHGAARADAEQLELRGFYEALADDDPHRIPSEAERKELANLKGRRASYLNAKKRFPHAWTRADEANLSAMEKAIVRLERVVLGIGARETAHA